MNEAKQTGLGKSGQKSRLSKEKPANNSAYKNVDKLLLLTFLLFTQKLEKREDKTKRSNQLKHGFFTGSEHGETRLK